jgi:hypothetical protein
MKGSSVCSRLLPNSVLSSGHGGSKSTDRPSDKCLCKQLTVQHPLVGNNIVNTLFRFRREYTQ